MWTTTGTRTGTTQTACVRPTGYKLASELTATSGDCNDGDAAINPATVWYKDADNDGYSDGTTQTACARPTGYKLSTELTATSGDCNDANAALNPATVWYKDADNDGYSDGTTQTACVRPTGYKLSTELTATSGDCDDANANVHVLLTGYVDADGDTWTVGGAVSLCTNGTLPQGYAATQHGEDCNDGDAAINPATVWYKDADGDGYSDGTTQTACVRPTGYKLASELTATSGDCNDADANVHVLMTGYVDADGDTWTVGGAQSLCTNGTLPTGYAAVQKGTDCNDNDAAIHPGATEICGDGIDQDCSGADLVCSYDYTGFTNGSTPVPSSYYNGVTANLEYAAFTGAPPNDILHIRIFGSRGASYPGAYTLPADPVFASQHTLVIIDQTCDGSMSCQKKYLATGGQIQVTSYPTSVNFTGTLTNVILREVTISGTPGAEVATVVSGGKTWSIPSYAFDVPIGYDMDGDGFIAGSDCNDNNANVHVAMTGYVDADGDTWTVAARWPSARTGPCRRVMRRRRRARTATTMTRTSMAARFGTKMRITMVMEIRATRGRPARSRPGM